MRGLLAIACLAASPSHGFELFPPQPALRSPLAHPVEPRLVLSRLHVSRATGDFGAALAGIGYDFGLARDRGWQLSVFGSADSLFNLDLPGDALVNTDYRIGLPLVWQGAAFAMRARAYHQSSHLGDELILGGNAPQRLDLSFEAIDLLVHWQRSGWRLYGGASHVLQTRSAGYRGSGVHAGFDYLGPAGRLGQRLTMGVDVKRLEAVDWHSGVSAKAGVKLGERRGAALLLELYDGFAPFGQFFVEDLRYRGATLQFDF